MRKSASLSLGLFGLIVAGGAGLAVGRQGGAPATPPRHRSRLRPPPLATEATSPRNTGVTWHKALPWYRPRLPGRTSPRPPSL